MSSLVDMCFSASKVCLQPREVSNPRMFAPKCVTVIQKIQDL